MGSCCAGQHRGGQSCCWVLSAYSALAAVLELIMCDCRLHKEQFIERRRGATAKRPRAAAGVAATSAAVASTAAVGASRALGRTLSRTELEASNTAGANLLLKAEMPGPTGQSASQCNPPAPDVAADLKSSKPGVLTGATRLKGSDSARCAVIRDIVNRTTTHTVWLEA